MTITVERGGRVTGRHDPAAHPRRPRTSYALFLLPGALAFLAVVVVPFLMNTYVGFTDWMGATQRPLVSTVQRAGRLPVVVLSW